MRSIRFSHRSLPLALFLLAILTYAPLLLSLGFYWDDWPFAWIAHFLGPTEFIEAFRPFRPFLGPIFTLTTAVVGVDPLRWQVIGVLSRFLLSLAAYWSLSQVWPRHKHQAIALALLLLVYPAYSQQWAALTHVNQEQIPLLFYILSFGATARALRTSHRKGAHTALALLLMAFGLFPTEYFATLEPLRFLFILAITGEHIPSPASRLRTSLKRWAPYLLLWLLNAAWLTFYYTSGLYDSYRVTAAGTLRTASWETLASLLREMTLALYHAVPYAWTHFIRQVVSVPTTPSTIAALAIAILSLVALGIYLAGLRPPEDSDDSLSWARWAIVIGVAGTLLGRIPSWAASLPLKPFSLYDRFLISMMLGAALLTLGLIELIRKRLIKTALLALLLAMAVGQQFLNANDFRWDWTRQRQFFWQLIWRAPDIQDGTLILTHQMPLDYESDLNLTAPLNWLYAPDFSPPELPYALLSTQERLGGPTLPSLEPGTPVTVRYRTVTFYGSTSDAIVIYFPDVGCLRVLDPVYANAETYAFLSPRLTDAIPLSDPTLIQTDAPAPQPPEEIFGPEPEHAWCYYYEKMEIARQESAWEEIIRLGKEAQQRNYAPGDPFEWLPLIEAHARMGDPARAVRLTRQTLAEDPRTRKGLCALWTRLATGPDTPPATVQKARQVRRDMACP
ncbi:MAG: hypothetical protein D6770_03645 [Anaerolineae bacterium]|nr:MAG: hypothetical protein D6770_03645 [Anaerolineae bacterium]